MALRQRHYLRRGPCSGTVTGRTVELPLLGQDPWQPLGGLETVDLGLEPSAGTGAGQPPHRVEQNGQQHQNLWQSWCSERPP